MEEFAQGGRLSPKKVKEFIPAGTLGIGEDGNVWLRKARKDGVTFWEEFLEIKDFRYFRVMSYDLKSGITFGGYLDESQEDVLQFTYKYNEGFIFTVINTETEKSNQIVYTYLERARSRAIEIRDNAENGRRQEEMTKAFTKIFDAFAKGLLRNEFTEEQPDSKPEYPEPKFKVGDIVKVIDGSNKDYKITQVYKSPPNNILCRIEGVEDELETVYPQDDLELSSETPEPKFAIGDFVRVLSDGQIVPSAYAKFKEYLFQRPNEDHEVKTGYEGYVVASYFEPSYKENRFVIKKNTLKGEMIDEFIIGEKGLELIKNAPSLRDEAIIKDTTFLYPTAPSLKESLGFSDPSVITSPSEAYKTVGTIFTKGKDPYTLMPVYGIYSTVLEKEILVGIQGIDYESIEFLKEKKIKINNNSESIRIQEYAFSKGFGWLGTPIGEPQTFDSFPAYFEFNSIKNIFVFKDEKEFLDSYYEEITLADLGLDDDSKPKPVPEFQIGDIVKVVDADFLIKKQEWSDKYKFAKKDENTAIKGSSGLVVGIEQVEFSDGIRTFYIIKKFDADSATVIQEFICRDLGLELVSASPQIGSEVEIIDWEYLYRQNKFKLQKEVGFKDPNIEYNRAVAKALQGSTGIIFARTVDKVDYMPVYALKIKEGDGLEILVAYYGIEVLSSPIPTEPPKETPSEEMEFVCNIDSKKINSAYVGAFYSKNKERIEKLNSEFSCKILEALVYLSDYENCGGGVQLPIQQVEEEDDLLGAIRNLK